MYLQNLCGQQKAQTSLHIHAVWSGLHSPHTELLDAAENFEVLIKPRGYKIFFMKFHLVMKIIIPKIKTFFMLNSAEHAQLSWAWKKFQNFVSILRF